jgi:hypothetical protein
VCRDHIANHSSQAQCPCNFIMTGRFEKYCQDILPRTYIDALDAGDHRNAFRVVHFNWKLIVTPKAMFSPSSEHQMLRVLGIVH